MKCEIEDFRVRNEEYATEMKTFAQSLEDKEGQIKEILKGLEGPEKMEGESEFLKEAMIKEELQLIIRLKEVKIDELSKEVQKLGTNNRFLSRQGEETIQAKMDCK